jgi:hypothetical protein
LQRRLLEKNLVDEQHYNGAVEEHRRSYLRRKAWQGRRRDGEPGD